MNAVFDPTILFITEDEWNNEQKRDEFLELLLCHLETIDKYNICNINWTEELQINLVEQPNIHPWFQSDLRNPMIATIHQKFYSRQELIPNNETECEIKPEFKNIFSVTDIHENFKKLTHTLLDYDEQFYLCVGNENKLTKQQYKFSCRCDNHYSPELINECDDWIKQLDIIKLFFPTNINDFDNKLINAINVIRKKNFNNKKLLFDYEFSNQFKKDLIKVTKHKIKILTNITKKLISTTSDARQDSLLKDEYIKQKKEYRFRVTGRPFSTRIHYKVNNKEIVIFLRYYDEGKHDDGL